jgi:pimeloyl-ACP methyl ester carboxylesterase
MCEPLRKSSRAVFVAMACVLAWHVQPAIGQPGEDVLHIKATPAAMHSRYYAPYALQAAAAYTSVAAFDATLRPGGLPSVNGSDVALAVRPYLPDEETTGRAWHYLKAWQYQFGSDTYLTCYDPSDTKCQKEYSESWRWRIGGGPAFHVWARTRYPHNDHDACSEVSIAFRGTVGSSGPDWISNFNPVAGYVADDHFYQLRRNIDAIIKKIAGMDCYRRARRSPQIVSVGHSLGGGLAQFAALANDPKGPRIAKVFAFDSTPVTSAGAIDRNIRSQNAEGLTIDRFRQTGEVLSKYLAPVERFEFPRSSSRCNPLVRTVDYDAVSGSGSIPLHSMAGLAARIVQLSYDDRGQQTYKAPPTTSCPTRYQVPAADEDGTPMAYAPNGSPVRIVQRNQLAANYSFAREQIVSTVKPMRPKSYKIITMHKIARIHAVHS